MTALLLTNKLYEIIILIYGGERVNTEASTSDILAFLARAKRLLSAGKYNFIPRRKNTQSLAEHGLTIKDAKDEIMDLVVGDYYKGPKRDFDATQSGDVWEFKKNIDGIPFYVKLKIQKTQGEDILKCLSFHEDDFR